MKSVFATLFLLALPIAAFAKESDAQKGSSDSKQQMKIARSGSQTSTKGPAENFTGNARVTPLVQPNENTRAAAAYVAFEPGARSAWHTHPNGQTLIVTEGSGLIQQWGGKVEKIEVGDVIWTPPNVKHWHGATPATNMIHISITENGKEKAAEWMEKVSDDQYRGVL